MHNHLSWEPSANERARAAKHRRIRTDHRALQQRGMPAPRTWTPAVPARTLRHCWDALAPWVSATTAVAAGATWVWPHLH